MLRSSGSMEAGFKFIELDGFSPYFIFSGLLYCAFRLHLFKHSVNFFNIFVLSNIQ